MTVEFERRNYDLTREKQDLVDDMVMKVFRTFIRKFGNTLVSPSEEIIFRLDTSEDFPFVRVLDNNRNPLTENKNFIEFFEELITGYGMKIKKLFDKDVYTTKTPIKMKFNQYDGTITFHPIGTRSGDQYFRQNINKIIKELEKIISDFERITDERIHTETRTKEENPEVVETIPEESGQISQTGSIIDFPRFVSELSTEIINQLSKMGPVGLTQFTQSLTDQQKRELVTLFRNDPLLLKDFRTSSSQALLSGIISPNTYRELVDLPSASFGSKVKIDQTKAKIKDNIDRRVVKTNKISFKK
ncbi:MAG: hypothetical protein ACRCX2_22905 [Paraclostridium sp.]